MLEHHRIVLMFSGQGSQYYQMGQAFFDGDARFRNTLLELDAIAKHSVGHSIVDVLYDKRRKKEEPFEAIKSTSAAIFMIEYALVRVLLDDGLKPDYLLAASMGLYAAAATAGALDPRDVLECISKASAVYEAHCPRGAMIAIFGSSDTAPRFARTARMLGYCSSEFRLAFRHFNHPKTCERDNRDPGSQWGHVSNDTRLISLPLALAERRERCREGGSRNAAMSSAEDPDHLLFASRRYRRRFSSHHLERDKKADPVSPDDRELGSARTLLLRRRWSGRHTRHLFEVQPASDVGIKDILNTLALRCGSEELSTTDRGA